jgi:tryptophan synthase alpha chain
LTRLSRIFERAAADDRLVTSIFLTVGHPSVSESRDLALAAIEAGAEIVELGVPFSDPLADGATIQASSYKALQNGVTVRDCLDVAIAVRKESDAALLLMGYTNPFLTYGFDRLVRDSSQAGLDGFIVPDLPPDEAGEFEEALQGHDLSIVYMVAPTTDDSRLKTVVSHADGFLYCVSLTGTTGGEQLDEGIDDFLARIRRQTAVPLVVGFGISRPDHMASLRGKADGAIIGSRFVRLVDEAPDDGRIEAARSFVQSMVEAARGG